MSENTLNPATPLAPRRPIAWAIGLGLLLLIIGTVVAVLGVVMGLLVFNGCSAANGQLRDMLGMFWLFILWPLALLATALAPPLLLGTGRGTRAALIAFIIGCLVSVLVWITWIPVGYYAFC